MQFWQELTQTSRNRLGVAITLFVCEAMLSLTDNSIIFPREAKK